MAKKTEEKDPIDLLPSQINEVIAALAKGLGVAATELWSAHRYGVCKVTYGEAFYSIEREDKEGNYKVFCKKDGMEKPFPESKE